MLCQKCQNEFPINVTIDGKERNLCNRRYCLTCSPFGKHNTRALVTNPTKKVCRDCGNPVSSNRRNFCNSCNVVKFRQRLKVKLVEYKGGKCEICGYHKCLRSLQFHHRDPSEKEFGITSQCKSFAILKREVDKCILLCANCHGEIHDKTTNIPE